MDTNCIRHFKHPQMLGLQRLFRWLTVFLEWFFILKVLYIDFHMQHSWLCMCTKHVFCILIIAGCYLMQSIHVLVTLLVCSLMHVLSTTLSCWYALTHTFTFCIFQIT